MPIPLARWREANAALELRCPCGRVMQGDGEEDLIACFVDHMDDCSRAREAAATIYVELDQDAG